MADLNTRQIQMLDLYLEQHAKLEDPDTFFDAARNAVRGRFDEECWMTSNGAVLAPFAEPRKDAEFHGCRTKETPATQ